jgi:PAS domain S-box-containing protein
MHWLNHSLKKDSGGLRVQNTMTVRADNGKRNRLNFQLADECERLQSLLDLNPVGIGMTRLRDGVLVDANKAFLKIIGYSRLEVLGKTSAELDIWVDLEARARVFSRVAAGKNVHEMASRIRRKNGEIRFVRFSASTCLYSGEKHVVGNWRDVTQEVLSEQERKITENRLRLSLDVMPITIFHQDIKLRYTFIVNPRIGRPVEAILGYLDRDLFAPDEAALLTRIKKRVIQRGVGERHEVSVRIGGQSRCFDTLIEPELGPAGEVVGIVCAAADITERKLREARYRSVLEDQTELITRYRPDGVMVYANEIYCRFFGKTEAQVVGCSWQPVAHPDDVPLIKEKLASLSAENPVVSIENRVFSSQGEERWMQFVNRGFFDTNGVLREIQSVGRDITERKQVETALSYSRAQVSALLEYSDHLREKQRKEISREIHDQMGVMLTSIGFRIDSLKRLTRDNPAIMNEVNSIRSLVTQANEAARSICNSLRPPVLDDLGLVSACRWYMKDWSALVGISARGRFQTISPRYPEKLSTDLFRIFQELLNNVAKHSGATGVNISLSCGVHGLRLRIADNGCGFAGDGPVQGFGLMGVKERLARYGGQLSCESSTKGAVVIVSVPYRYVP